MESQETLEWHGSMRQPSWAWQQRSQLAGVKISHRLRLALIQRRVCRNAIRATHCQPAAIDRFSQLIRFQPVRKI
jgi:hypothetical protein